MEECECMVCFSPVNETNYCQLTCKHPLCFGCLTKLNNNTCPMCRRSLSSDLANIEKYLRTLDPNQPNISQSNRRNQLDWPRVMQAAYRQPRNDDLSIFNMPNNTYLGYNVGPVELPAPRYIFNGSLNNSIIGDNLNAINDMTGAMQALTISNDLPGYVGFGGAHFLNHSRNDESQHTYSRTMTFNQESSLKLSIRYSQVIIQPTNEPNITMELTGDDLEDVITDGNLITVTDFPVWESVIINIPNNIKPNLNLNLSGRLDCKIDLNFLDASIFNAASAKFQTINKAIINIGGISKCSIENILIDLTLDAAGSSNFKAKSIKTGEIRASGTSETQIDKIEEASNIQASGSSKIEINQSSGIKGELSGMSQLNITQLTGSLKSSCSGSSNIHILGMFTNINNETSGMAAISTIGHCTGSCFLSASGSSKINHRGRIDGEIKKVGSLMSMIYVHQ